MRSFTHLAAGVLAAAVIGTAACEQSPYPTIAGLAGNPGTRGNGTGHHGSGTGSGNTGGTSGGSTGGAISISLAPATATITVGQSVQLVSNYFDDQVIWRSYQPTVAGVSPSGTVRGFTPGTAIIAVRLRADSTREARAAITVLPTPGTGVGVNGGITGTNGGTTGNGNGTGP